MALVCCGEADLGNSACGSHRKPFVWPCSVSRAPRNSPRGGRLEGGHRDEHCVPGINQNSGSLMPLATRADGVDVRPGCCVGCCCVIHTPRRACVPLFPIATGNRSSRFVAPGGQDLEELLVQAREMLRKVPETFLRTVRSCCSDHRNTPLDSSRSLFCDSVRWGWGGHARGEGADQPRPPTYRETPRFLDFCRGWNKCRGPCSFPRVFKNDGKCR